MKTYQFSTNKILLAVNFIYEVALWVAERNFFQEFFNNKKVRLHATAPALDLHVKAYLKSIIKTIIVLPIIILSKTNPIPKKGTRMSICSTRRRTLIPWPDESLNHSMQNIPSRCYGNGFTTSQSLLITIIDLWKVCAKCFTEQLP